MKLADGTVSDGKLDTYMRCVEALLGSAQTFFTSAFSAQGRRQLSSYRNAEIKALLADLLGLDEIRILGSKASETAKLIKAGLTTIRQERLALEAEATRIAGEIAQLGDTQQRIAAAQGKKTAGLAAVDAAKEAFAKVKVVMELAIHTDVRRTQLHAEKQAVIDEGKAALSALDHQQQRETGRLMSLDKRIAERVTEAEKKRAGLWQQRSRYAEIIEAGRRIERAVRHLPLAEQITAARERRVQLLYGDTERLNALLAGAAQMREKMAGIERVAGQTVLRANELARRFGLTSEVPCAGTALQGQCKLLGDARETKRLLPSAELQVRRLEDERRELSVHLAESDKLIATVSAAPAALAAAEKKLQRSRARASATALLAARQGELLQARATIALVDAQLQELSLAADDGVAEEQAERAAIYHAKEQIAVQRAAQTQRYRDTIRRIDLALAALPEPFDDSQIVQAQHAIEQAKSTLAGVEAEYVAAMRDQQRMEELVRGQAANTQKMVQLDAGSTDIEDALGVWTLFARCMSNDGLIALSIDDAGPMLSGLTNELLLACYGPRFTVSIKTQVETSRREAREGFDIVVHDADSGTSKSVTAMSGGERVWINECLTRAIALYLAKTSGRRYETLFSDEADGALDTDRKRMFIAMKREVLRIGRYDREYFVSQTPELTAMADAVIDLEKLGRAGECVSLRDAGVSS